MAITVLNNISDLTAEQALGNTQSSLQKTLTQLSTGLKINSGSDDAAGLSIANGMTANIAALTQSQQNASNGVGMLQTADGALSQVTTLLNRAVTISTEGSTSGITSSQYTALNTEFQSILSEVNQIGASTNFNGQNVFSSNAPVSFSSTQASLLTSTALAANTTVTISDSGTGGTFVFNSGSGGSTVSALNLAIGAAAAAGTLSSTVSGSLVGGVETIANSVTTDGITVSTNAAALGPMVAASAASSSNTVYIGDGTTAAGTNTNVTTSINALSATALSLNTDTLTSAATSQAALAAVNAAITNISAQRGTIGASVNRLNAATSVMSDQVTNLQSAVNSLQNADIGTTVANMTQYNVLESTGMAALQQANQAQQAVLKLVQ
jgi:flagellin